MAESRRYREACKDRGYVPPNKRWNDNRRRHYEARRAKKRGAELGEPFTNVEIFERDGWRCQLCRKKVDHRREWPDPMSPSLDHIIPLSQGGEHARENVQLAHLRCNIRKKDSAANEQLRLLG